MQLPERLISPHQKIVMTRRLPVPGEVLAQRGQQVVPLQVVGRAEVPRRYRALEVARWLGQPDVDMDSVMLKAEGDPVEAGEPVAVSQGRIAIFRRTVVAPAAGVVAAIGAGWVLIQTHQISVELRAFINGKVSKIVPGQGVVIETTGALVHAVCGFGGEAYGPLRRLVNYPFENIAPEAINDTVKNAVLLGGRTITGDLLRQAERAQVKGIIVGSIDASLLKLRPPVKVSVVATEGFGDMPMSAHTFGLLATLTGKEVSVRGSTPGLALGLAHQEPPVIITSTGKVADQSEVSDRSKPAEIGVGSRVRVVRGKFMGASGTVQAIPAQPQSTEAGIVVPGAQVKFDTATHYIPWANLEQTA